MTSRRRTSLPDHPVSARGRLPRDCRLPQDRRLPQDCRLPQDGSACSGSLLGLIAGLTVLTLLLPLTGCHHSQQTPPAPVYTAPSAPEVAERPSPRTHPPAPIERSTPYPEPEGSPVSTEIGLASWYGPPYHNHQAADGSIFDQNALTVAHRELPLGTVVRVTNLATGASVVARVTDRGPFVQGRILDLSLGAAKAIDVYRAGVAKVKVEAFANPTADPAGKWCVQIGTFLTPDDAIQTRNDLLRRYAPAKVIEFQGPTGFWVRINPPQADRLTATRIAESIHIPDADPYLVRLN